MYVPIGWGKLVKSKKYKTWIDNTVPLIESQMAPAKNFPISVAIKIVGGRGISCWSKNDTDNFSKSLIDAIVRAGVVPDDEKKYINKVSVEYIPFPSSKGAPLTWVGYEEPEEE